MAKIVHWDGTETRIHKSNDGSGTVTFEERQDAEPIVENTKALHREGIHGSSDIRHAARFPRVLVDMYCQQKGITFSEWTSSREHKRAMLNDPDLKAFRIWPGAV